MKSGFFTIILFVFCFFVGLLSSWLNILFQENSRELSFPFKPHPAWQMRSLKIIMAAFLCLLLMKYCLAGTLPAYKLCHATTGEAFSFAIYAAFLLTMFCSDMEQQVIFDKQLALFAIFGLLHCLLFTGTWLQQAGYGLLAGFAFLLLAVITRGGIGGGDIKLIAALGLWLDPAALKLTALGGIIIGGVWALLAILLTKKSRKDFIPYGPSFIIAALISYMLFLPAG